MGATDRESDLEALIFRLAALEELDKGGLDYLSKARRIVVETLTFTDDEIAAFARRLEDA
jgi:hypothetical protein